MFFAELSVRYGLRKGVQDDPPEPDPSKKTSEPTRCSNNGLLQCMVRFWHLADISDQPINVRS
jgi:hypothetical protein